MESEQDKINLLAETIIRLFPGMGFFVMVFPFGEDELKPIVRSNVNQEDIANILQQQAQMSFRRFARRGLFLNILKM